MHLPQHGLRGFVPRQPRTCLGFTPDGAAAHLRSLEPFALNNQSLLDCALSLKVPSPKLPWFGNQIQHTTCYACQDSPRPPFGTQDSMSKQKIGQCFVAVMPLSGFLEGALDLETSRKACCSSGKAGGRRI